MSSKSKSKSVALAKLKKLHTLSNDALSELNTRVTIGDLVNKLFTYYAANQKHNYLLARQRRWLQHLHESFNNLNAARLTTAHQQGYRAKGVAEGASGATVNRELALLRKACRLAADHEPPLVARVPRFVLVRENNARKGFATLEQLDAIKQAASERGLWLRTFIEMLATLGWRRGELQGLRVKNINPLELW